MSLNKTSKSNVWMGDQKQTIQIPFRTFIKGGDCQFKVRVPEAFDDVDRLFTFGYLAIAPDFFSLQVANEGLDEEQDLDVRIDSYARLQVSFTDEKIYGVSLWQVPQTITNAKEFVLECNKHMYEKKDDFVLHTPFFFDWIIQSTNLVNQLPKEYIADLADILYNETFDPTNIHSGLLPPDIAKNIPQANNFQFPNTPHTKFDLRFIRIRMVLMPQTRVTFSNENVLIKLGFSQEQYGKRQGSGHGQIIIRNDTNIIQYITGKNAVDWQFNDIKNLKINVHPVSKDFSSAEMPFRFPKRLLLDRQEMVESCNKMLLVLSQSVNYKFNVALNTNKTQYLFSFPNDDRGISIKIHVPVELAVAFGFSNVNVIDRNTMNKGFLSSTTDQDKSFKKATALAFDTGVLLVTVDSISSNTTSGTSDQVIASLFPRDVGILESIPMSNCFGMTWARLTNYGQLEKVSTAAWRGGSLFDRFIKFNVLRIYDDEQVKNFSWRLGAYVYGILLSEKL